MPPNSGGLGRQQPTVVEEQSLPVAGPLEACATPNGVAPACRPRSGRLASRNAENSGAELLNIGIVCQLRLSQSPVGRAVLGGNHGSVLGGAALEQLAGLGSLQRELHVGSPSVNPIPPNNCTPWRNTTVWHSPAAALAILVAASRRRGSSAAIVSALAR